MRKMGMDSVIARSIWFTTAKTRMRILSRSLLAGQGQVFQGATAVTLSPN